MLIRCAWAGVVWADRRSSVAAASGTLSAPGPFGWARLSGKQNEHNLANTGQVHSRLAFLSRLFRSRYQLEYSQAQDILDGRPPKPGHEVAAADRPALRRNLALLAALAEHRRRLRLEVGGQMGAEGCACACVLPGS